MSSVSGISSSSYNSVYADIASTRRQRPDASTLAADLFAKLDTTDKGYIDQSDLTTALSSLSSSTSSTSSTGSTSSASTLFSELDSNGDGKVTEDELASTLKKLTASLDSQFDQMRMSGAMPPPPPSGTQDTGSTDTGFTKDELTAQLSQIGSTDSQRSTLINDVINNFSAADTNGDGKVTFAEAMAYEQSKTATASSSTDSTSSSTSTSSTAASSTTSTSSTTSSAQSDAQMFSQLMDILRLYGSSSDSSSKDLLSTLITTTA